jgi:nucleoside-diphosphate-sugar epimerase
MNVLIIGGTRFVGYSLTWRLLAGGHRLTLFNRGRIPDPFGTRVERLRGDRRTADLSRLLCGRSFDVVYDFAAYVEADVRGALEVFEGGRAGHYVFISSGQVYLVRERCPWPAREEDYDGPLMARPEDAADLAEWDYGVGKRACEDLLAETWERSRFPSTRIRIPMVEGERDHLRRLEGYLWRILDGGPLLVPDGGTNPVRHVYVGDLVRALADIGGHTPAIGRAFNLSQEETPTLADLLTTIAALVGAKPRLVPVSRAELAAAGLDVRRVSPFSGRWMSMLDTALARRELGFEHEPVRSYMDKIVTTFLSHPPAKPPEAYGQREAELALASSLG